MLSFVTGLAYSCFNNVCANIQLHYINVVNTNETLSRKKAHFVRMLRKRSVRHAQGRFVVEGARAVEQVIRNGVLETEFLVMTTSFLRNRETRTNVSGTEYEDKDHDRLNVDQQQFPYSKIGVPIFTTTASVFNQITDTDAAQGLLAVCNLPRPSRMEDILSRSGTLLAVDQIQDPGNLGTLIRTAAWFGLTGVVVSPGTVDLFHPKVVRSTAGSTGVLPWFETDLAPFLDKAGMQKWQVNLLDNSNNSQPYGSVDPMGKDILVVGNEANGISEKVLKMGFRKLRIDPADTDSGVESLNASIAAAIVMAHYFFARPSN